MMIVAGAIGMLTGLILRQPSFSLFGSVLTLFATAGFLAGACRDEKDSFDK